MRTCPFCAHENPDEHYFCGQCDSYMGSRYPGGDKPIESEKHKAQVRFEAAKRRNKGPDYIQLFHGPRVSRRTYERMRRRTWSGDIAFGIFVAFVLVLLVALLRSCVV